MKKNLVTIVLVSMLVCLGMCSALLLARNIELTSRLDSADKLTKDLYNEMIDVMDDENLVAMYLAKECDIYDCEIVIDMDDGDGYVDYTAYENGDVSHCGSINREYYKNKFKNYYIIEKLK